MARAWTICVRVTASTRGTGRKSRGRECAAHVHLTDEISQDRSNSTALIPRLVRLSAVPSVMTSVTELRLTRCATSISAHTRLEVTFRPSTSRDPA